MMNAAVEHWQVRKSVARHADGMVAAQHALAARAGGALLDAGGNAIDAAIASALALGAVEPWMCGLGGSGLMLIWLADEQRAVALDFQGVLAAATSLDDYPVDPELPHTLMGFPTVVDNANVEGHRSITVPGAAAGFDHALRCFGTASLAEVATPAIALARRGLVVDWHSHLQMALAMPCLRKDRTSASLYLPNGCPAPPESIIATPVLAETLERFAASGADGFYRGTLADDIAADLREHGSLLVADDLHRYEVIEREPLCSEHRGTQLYTAGDISGGRRLHDCLAHVAEHLPDTGTAPDAHSFSVYAEALAQAWQHHDRRLGRVTEAGSCTSHLSTIDRHGNMVALTHTLLNRFGSGVTLPRTGLLMNNAVSYFDPRAGLPTTMAPAKRINASNMCPTVGVRAGQAWLAIGASGGNQIMPAVTQVIALMLDFGWSLERAMNSGRLDLSSGARLRVDPALGDDIVAGLADTRPVELAQRLVYPKLYGCVSAVAREHDRCVGICDPSHPAGDACGPDPFPALAVADDVHGVRA